MKNRVLRWVVVIVAILAVAGAGYQVWSVEQAAASERSIADTFERHARQLALGLVDLRAAMQAYVADGQVTDVWQKTADRMRQTVSAQADALRGLARSPEGQGAVEAAIEALGALGRIDSRAKEFLGSSQRLSASDVVFAEAAPHVARVVAAIDTARGQESVASAIRLEQLRVRQLTWAGGAAACALLGLFLLAPLARPTPAVERAEGQVDDDPGSGLGIGHMPLRANTGSTERGSATASPLDTPSLAETADVCALLARVQEPRELPALLERAAGVLRTTGIVVWMPDGPGGALRPALAHGFTPLVVTRMGTIPADADNATAAAYRSRSLQVVPPEGVESGAIAAPLVTAEGCSGVMTAEIRPGVSAESVGAAAAIIASQLATLISPQSQTDARTAP